MATKAAMTTRREKARTYRQGLGLSGADGDVVEQAFLDGYLAARQECSDWLSGLTDLEAGRQYFWSDNEVALMDSEADGD